MGDVSDSSSLAPRAIERPLSWGATLRGIRLGSGPDVAFLVHEPAADIDDWGALPSYLARTLSLQVTVVDLPGHGLSDGPWEPARLPELLRELFRGVPGEGRRYLVAAGAPALASLHLAAELKLAGLICLSPEAPPEGSSPLRSARVPKLFVAGSLAGSDLGTARRFAATCGGWTVVTSLPVAARGTGLIASSWRERLIEEIGSFLRDCQRRPATPSLPNASPRQIP